MSQDNRQDPNNRQDNADYPPLPPFSTGCSGRCPRCGQGKVFAGFLNTAPSCKVCGLDLAFADSGDGPAIFIILIAGFIIIAGALVTEVKYQPPYWVHALIWLPLVIALPLSLLRPAKGLMIALQYNNQAREGRIER